MTHRIRLGVSMAAVAVFAVAGCGSSKKSSSATAAPATTAAAAATTAAAAATTAAAAATTGGAATTAAGGAAATGAAITIKGFAFQVPAGLKAGASVTITDQDSAAHTFTDKGGKFDVKVAGNNGTATLTLPAAGTYQIICKIHSQMSGTLTVA